jgi:hypothetical protein
MLAAVLLSLALGVFAAYRERRSYDVVLSRDLVAPIAAERAEAVRLGMRPVRRGTARIGRSPWKLELPVGAEECHSLIVGVTGLGGIDALLLLDAAGATLANLHFYPQSRVEQVQWCSSAPTTVSVELRVALARRLEAPEVRWEFLSGPRGPGLDERTLTRNSPVEDALRERLDREERAAAIASVEERARATEAALVDDATERTEPLRVDLRSALLVPPERATFLAAQRALMTRDARPLLAPYFEPAPAWLPQPVPLPEASGMESAALLRVTGGWERVLAVVDFDVLGPSCVAVTFARIAEPAAGAPVVRVAIPSLARTELTERDGVWSDRVCPAVGLALYTIPADAAAPYDVRVFAIPGARPPFPRRTWDGELLPSEERTALAQSCPVRARNASPSACLSLARALERDGASSLDVDLAFERACLAGGSAACGQLSSRLFASGAAASRAVELERLGCDGGDWLTCERRATRLRSALDPTADLPEVRRLYELACTRGRLPAACANLAQMDRLQLGTP